MNTKPKAKKAAVQLKKPKFFPEIPYSRQAVACSVCAVLSLVLLFFNLFFSGAFAIISIIFYTMTKPRSKMDYNNRWFATMGVILSLTSLTVIILTHIVVNGVFNILLS